MGRVPGKRAQLPKRGGRGLPGAAARRLSRLRRIRSGPGAAAAGLAAALALAGAAACTAPPDAGAPPVYRPHVPEAPVPPPGATGRWVAVERHTVRAGRPSMGTLLEITLVVDDPARGRTLVERLFAQAADLERVFTTYVPGSPLNRLSDAAGTGPRTVDPRLARILEESVAWTRATGGAFDVTVGPLVDLWRAAAARGTPPADAELAAVLLRVGAGAIRVRGDAVELARPGMRLDLGAIAKGWALDRMAEGLAAEGVGDFLLNFGQSSVLARGRPADAPDWGLAVRDPRDALAGAIALRDRGFSVSGSLGQWAEIDGVRYGHVIDPRSGRALTRNVQAAVVAPTATAAEVWSTALAVQGAAGLARVEAAPGVEAHVQVEEGGPGGPVAVHATAGWEAATDFEPARAP